MEEYQQVMFGDEGQPQIGSGLRLVVTKPGSTKKHIKIRELVAKDDLWKNMSRWRFDELIEKTEEFRKRNPHP